MLRYRTKKQPGGSGGPGPGSTTLNHSSVYLNITSLREKMRVGGLREFWHSAEQQRGKDNHDRRAIISVIVLIHVDRALKPMGI